MPDTTVERHAAPLPHGGRDRRRSAPECERIAIVGAGPFCTYALDRLEAGLARRLAGPPLSVVVFERTGSFGDGAVHDGDQLGTSYLNRVCAQIGLAADNPDGSASRTATSFPEWVAQQPRGELPDVPLGPTDVPPRYLLGRALRDAFASACERLRDNWGVSVTLEPRAVSSVARNGDAGYLVTAEGAPRPFAADHVLLLTGHSTQSPPAAAADAKLAVGCRNSPSARVVTRVYPLDRSLSMTRIQPGEDVVVSGLGLTAFDAILALTEGRGGRFVADGDNAPTRLRYEPSGNEPGHIYGFSPSGLPVTCRPLDQKIVDPQRLQHRAVFFTSDAITALRRTRGQPGECGGGAHRLQLDFERDLLPLMLLEMGYVFYRTAFGDAFADSARRQLDPFVSAFASSVPGAQPEVLLEPLLAAAKDRAAAAGIPRFDWRAHFHPLQGRRFDEPAAYHQALLELMQSDLRAAMAGNLTAPGKAAMDGVWRDLRRELTGAVDRGGLTPDSQRFFDRTYLRLYNRLSNGAGIDCMRKITALAECRLLDLSPGPGVRTRYDEATDSIAVTGPQTGFRADVDTLICARTHRFDLHARGNELYRNMHANGLVRPWRNPGPGRTRGYSPGGLDVTPRFHPVGEDGVERRDLTLLGGPVEGVCYFQNSLARPGTDDSLFVTLEQWVADTLKRRETARGAP